VRATLAPVRLKRWRWRVALTDWVCLVAERLRVEMQAAAVALAAEQQRGMDLQRGLQERDAEHARVIAGLQTELTSSLRAQSDAEGSVQVPC
jgi:hypothetical protein